MESRKIRASSVGQMTKHLTIVRSGQTGGDLTLDSNGDGNIDFVLPPGAIVTSVEVRGTAFVSSGTCVLDVGPVSDPDGIKDGYDLETAGGSATISAWGTADTTGDDANKIRLTVDSSANPSAGIAYVWLVYRFAGDIAWAQADLTDPA